jgi:DNA-binding transcriptional regulator GbsR (MarR family)
MPEEDRRVREQHFVEEVGLYFERAGVPPMAGRVLGHLMICEPPVQSSSQLVDALFASKASISTSTRLLMRMGFIERVPTPGQRGSSFRLRAGAFSTALTQKLSLITVFRELLDSGLDALEGASAPRRARLQDARDLYAFFEAEMPLLIERWKNSREKP